MVVVSSVTKIAIQTTTKLEMFFSRRKKVVDVEFLEAKRTKTSRKLLEDLNWFLELPSSHPIFSRNNRFVSDTLIITEIDQTTVVVIDGHVERFRSC